MDEHPGRFIMIFFTQLHWTLVFEVIADVSNAIYSLALGLVIDFIQVWLKLLTQGFLKLSASPGV